MTHPYWVYAEAMAKTIQIRNVPEKVHRALRARAAEAGESLSDYLLREIQRVATRPAIADVLLRAERIQSRLSTRDVVDAVREGRDRE